MSGLEAILALIGLGGAAGGAGAAGAGAGAVGAGAATDALGAATGMALQRAGEMGAPAFSGSMSPGALMTQAGGAGGGGGGDKSGGALGKMTANLTGKDAMEVMKLAAQNRAQLPNLPPLRAMGGSTPGQASALAFLQQMAQRRQQARQPMLMGS